MRRRTTIVSVVCVAMSLLAPAILATVDVAGAQQPTPDEGDDDPPAGRYEPLTPCRLADTRTGEGISHIDDHTSRIDLDRCGIPAEATALVATTTIVDPSQSGWLVAYPTGSPRPLAATLNWSAGMTRGNSSTIAVGADFAVELYRSDGVDDGDVVVDVVGAFVPAASASRGRFVPATDALRLVDTRLNGTDRPQAGTTIRVPLPAAVPADADALAVNFTVVDTSAAAYLTAFPAGSARPLASALNADAAGQFRSASSIVPVSGDGFDVYVSAPTHVVVDMTGWFTGPDAESSTDGLFVALPPLRLRDTRTEPQAIYAGGAAEIALPPMSTGGNEKGPAAVAVSITMIGSDDRGFVTASAARVERPDTASGYSLRNEITAQFAVSPVSESGLAVYSERGTDLTIDLLGWFTGEPVEPTSDEPAPNPQRPLRVLAVGDSTMAGIRWYGALGALTGASWTYSAESCRRLVRWSCRGRERRYPPTALATIQSLPDVFDVLVMMTGYNDRADTFEADLDRIVSAARSRGIRRVVWLTYAREFRSDTGGADAYQVYEFHNALLRAAAERYDDLVVAEWSKIARERPDWIHYDGIHFTDDGAYGNADFVSRAVAHATGQPCPVPYVSGTATGGVCEDPGTMPAPDVRELYEFTDTVTQCWEVGPNRTVECVQDPYTL